MIGGRKVEAGPRRFLEIRLSEATSNQKYTIYNMQYTISKGQCRGLQTPDEREETLGADDGSWWNGCLFERVIA